MKGTEFVNLLNRPPSRLQHHAGKSGYRNVLSLRAFLTLGHVKFNALPFSKRLVSAAAYGAVMSKYIGTTLALNKTKAFLFIKPFDGSSSSL